MLRLVIGYRTASRSTDPTVLFLGHSGAGAQEAIDSATDFEILETAEVPVLRRARRSQAAIVPPAPARKSRKSTHSKPKGLTPASPEQDSPAPSSPVPDTETGEDVGYDAPTL